MNKMLDLNVVSSCYCGGNTFSFPIRKEPVISALIKAKIPWKIMKLRPYEIFDKLMSLNVSFILFYLSSSMVCSMNFAPMLVMKGMIRAKMIGIVES